MHIDPIPPLSLCAVFAQVLALYASAFEDSFLHLGGDEAGDYACWEADAGVKRWAGQRGLDSMRDVRKYFGARLLPTNYTPAWVCVWPWLTPTGRAQRRLWAPSRARRTGAASCGKRH